MLKGERSSKSGKGKPVDYHDLRMAQVDEEGNAFRSRLFMVRFSEENIELQDFCQFRTEVDLVPGQTRYPFFVDIELYFTETETSCTPQILAELPDVVRFLHNFA